MSALITTKRTDRLLGVFVPPYIHEYMALYCLAKGGTKSRLVRALVEPWIDKTRRSHPDEELIEEIVESIKIKWRIEKSTTYNPSYKKFKETVEQELISKGIKPVYIMKIINQME